MKKREFFIPHPPLIDIGEFDIEDVDKEEGVKLAALMENNSQINIVINEHIKELFTTLIRLGKEAVLLENISKLVHGLMVILLPNETYRNNRDVYLDGSLADVIVDGHKDVIEEEEKAIGLIDKEDGEELDDQTSKANSALGALEELISVSVAASEERLSAETKKVLTDALSKGIKRDLNEDLDDDIIELLVHWYWYEVTISLGDYFIDSELSKLFELCIQTPAIFLENDPTYRCTPYGTFVALNPVVNGVNGESVDKGRKMKFKTFVQ